MQTLKLTPDEIKHLLNCVDAVKAQTTDDARTKAKLLTKLADAFDKASKPLAAVP